MPSKVVDVELEMVKQALVDSEDVSLCSTECRYLGYDGFAGKWICALVGSVFLDAVDRRLESMMSVGSRRPSRMARLRRASA